MDAQFLLCKIHFILREHVETLKCINVIEQDPSNFDGSRRRLKMSADLFAIKGRFVLGDFPVIHTCGMAGLLVFIVSNLG